MHVYGKRGREREREREREIVCVTTKQGFTIALLSYVVWLLVGQPHPLTPPRISWMSLEFWHHILCLTTHKLTVENICKIKTSYD